MICGATCGDGGHCPLPCHRAGPPSPAAGVLSADPTIASIKPVRGIITLPLLPDGVPRPVPHRLLDEQGGLQPLTVELVRGTDDQDGPGGRPDHPTALGLACVRDVVDGRVYRVKDLPPYSELRLTEPPVDDEGRELLEDINKEGLPVADSPPTGKA